METDYFGCMMYTEDDLIDLAYTNKLKNIRVNHNHNNQAIEQFNKYVEELDLTKVFDLKKDNITLEEFDLSQQSIWLMPDQYNNLDIEEFIKNKCTTQQELERFYFEFEKFKIANLISLLQYLVFLVDLLRSNNIIWGVGRGSSVASFILYKIGIHKIDPLKYNLDFTDFLK